jgi:hypothetical protein
MNVHKANLGSQLSIFDTGLFTRVRPRPGTPSPGRALTRTTPPNEFTRAPTNDPPERFCMGAQTTETNRQGRAVQMSCTNMHKANLGSQLSIFNTGSFARARPRPKRAPSNDPPERPTRTTRPNEFTRAPSNDPPERAHTGALKRPAQTTHPNEFTRAPSNDPPERPAQTSSHGCPQTTRPNDRNEPTRESRANKLHERAQSQPRVTT